MNVISNLGLLWFGLTCSMIDAENSRHFLNQSDLKLKLIATWSVAFSRALRSLNVSLLARCDIYIYISFLFAVVITLVSVLRHSIVISAIYSGFETFLIRFCWKNWHNFFRRGKTFIFLPRMSQNTS